MVIWYVPLVCPVLLPSSACSDNQSIRRNDGVLRGLVTAKTFWRQSQPWIDDPDVQGLLCVVAAWLVFYVALNSIAE